MTADNKHNQILMGTLIASLMVNRHDADIEEIVTLALDIMARIDTEFPILV